MPKDIPLPEDSYLLDKVKLADEEQSEKMTQVFFFFPTSTLSPSHLLPQQTESHTPFHQVMLLCMCINVKNTNPAHGLTNEEMSPYVSSVVSRHNNWMIHSMALLQRCRVEFEGNKTKERSVLQHQELVDQFSDELGKEEASALTRLLYVHYMDFPPFYSLRLELARRYLKIGVAASALNIFQVLEMVFFFLFIFLILILFNFIFFPLFFFSLPPSA